MSNYHVFVYDPDRPLGGMLDYTLSYEALEWALLNAKGSEPKYDIEIAKEIDGDLKIVAKRVRQLDSRLLWAIDETGVSGPRTKRRYYTADDPMAYFDWLKGKAE